MARAYPNARRPVPNGPILAICRGLREGGLFRLGLGSVDIYRWVQLLVGRFGWGGSREAMSLICVVQVVPRGGSLGLAGHLA